MKNIDLGIYIHNPGPLITWYQIETKLCSIALPYVWCLPSHQLILHKVPPP